MKNFFGTVLFTLAGTDKTALIWCGAVLLTMLILAVLHHKWKYDEQRLKRWKNLCFIPFLITSVHYFIYVSGADGFLSNYTPMYLISVLAFIPMMCAEQEKGYRIFGTVTAVLSVVFALRFCLISNQLHNFSRKSYTGSFHALVRELDRSYVIRDWKEIDFYALEDKYMPMVEEAERKKDKAMFGDAVTLFCSELHDGHVEVSTHYDRNKYHSVFELTDYGLSMVQLDNGDIIAVCTEDEVKAVGIDDGTVITKWDGRPAAEAAEEMIPAEGEPVESNGRRLALITLSATGGETVEVTFIGKSGREQTAVLSAIENEHTYDEMYSLFFRWPEHLTEFVKSNFSTRMLDDKCGYMQLSAETSGGSVRDELAFYTGESKWAKEMFRRKLRRLKEQGMEYLVIDLRNNMGGSGEIGNALVSLLTDEELCGECLGIRRNGGYVKVSERIIRGNGEFSDLKVVALTNLNCVSAGDSAARCLSKLPNVTLAGITDPNGSGQMIGGRCVLSKSIVSVSYPVQLVLDETGEPYNDTRADGISRDPVEVRIPLDYDAAMKIFRDGEDYELEWAVDYLEEGGGHNK